MPNNRSKKVKRWTDFDPVMVETLRSAHPFGYRVRFDDERTARSFQHRMKLMCVALRTDMSAPDDLRMLADKESGIAWSAPKFVGDRWYVKGYPRTPYNVPIDEVIRQLHANAVSTEAK